MGTERAGMIVLLVFIEVALGIEALQSVAFVGCSGHICNLSPWEAEAGRSLRV